MGPVALVIPTYNQPTHRIRADWTAKDQKWMNKSTLHQKEKHPVSVALIINPQNLELNKCLSFQIVKFLDASFIQQKLLMQH